MRWLYWSKIQLKMFLSMYSRVPNKRTGRLLEIEKKSHLYALIWDYSFINFQQKVLPIRLFSTMILFICELSHLFSCLFHCLIFGLTNYHIKVLILFTQCQSFLCCLIDYYINWHKFPPIRLLVFQKISHLYFYSVLYFY